MASDPIDTSIRIDVNSGQAGVDSKQVARAVSQELTRLFQAGSSTPRDQLGFGVESSTVGDSLEAQEQRQTLLNETLPQKVSQWVDLSHRCNMIERKLHRSGCSLPNKPEFVRSVEDLDDYYARQEYASQRRQGLANVKRALDHQRRQIAYEIMQALPLAGSWHRVDLGGTVVGVAKFEIDERPHIPASDRGLERFPVMYSQHRHPEDSRVRKLLLRAWPQQKVEGGDQRDTGQHGPKARETRSFFAQLLGIE